MLMKILVIFDWWMETQGERDDWKSVSTGDGAQSVRTTLAEQMQLLSADSLDCLLQVRPYLYIPPHITLHFFHK